MSKAWFLIGAGRGMGVPIAKAALAAGNALIATGILADRLEACDAWREVARDSDQLALSVPP